MQTHEHTLVFTQWDHLQGRNGRGDEREEVRNPSDRALVCQRVRACVQRGLQTRKRVYTD